MKGKHVPFYTKMIRGNYELTLGESMSSGQSTEDLLFPQPLKIIQDPLPTMKTRQTVFFYPDLWSLLFVNTHSPISKNMIRFCNTPSSLASAIIWHLRVFVFTLGSISCWFQDERFCQ